MGFIRKFFILFVFIYICIWKWPQFNEIRYHELQLYTHLTRNATIIFHKHRLEIPPSMESREYIITKSYNQNYISKAFKTKNKRLVFDFVLIQLLGEEKNQTFFENVVLHKLEAKTILYSNDINVTENFKRHAIKF